ncbi:MAG TPA: mercury(II) reductase [Solirubrobacteraceae bacterium]|nr:mercury(II) reductase [Solirubrobacteraceae bacterium]
MEMDAAELEISGMTCADCAEHVRAALERAGARAVSIDWRRGRGRIAAGGPSQMEMNEALAGTRYRVQRVTEPSASAWPQDPGRGTRDYELVILGSGSAAFAAAIRGRDLGARVLMAEHQTIGGTCVNIGCVPSKSLLVSSERHRISGVGSLAQGASVKSALVEQLRQQKYIDLVGVYGFELRPGRARLLGAHTVQVDGEAVSADAILIATGARPAVPPIQGLDQAGFLTSTSALELTEPPGRLAVIGAGAIGLELGQMFAGYGSQVTFIELLRVAPFDEPEISEAMRGILEQDGRVVLEGARTERVRLDGAEKVLEGTVGSERFEVRVDEILVATSRIPNTEGLGLEAAGVQTDRRGAVIVDERQRTTVPSIYAAGDVTIQPQFVYVAAAGGAAAAENALGDGDRRLDFSNLPRIIFTTPQIASAGLTEQQAREQGFEVQTSVLALEAIPRALVNGDARGLFKLVAETGSRRLLGASIIAEAAGEVIQSVVLAIKAGMTIDDLAATWAPYLTMAEGLKLTAQTFGRDVAKLSCCAA